MICLLVGLIGANFVIQFYIGAKVFKDSEAPLLKMLNGTRTFICGWRFPELRSVMLAWTVVLIFLLLSVAVLGVLAFMLNS